MRKKCEEIFKKIDELSAGYVDIWEDICNIESPTEYKKGVDECGKYLLAMAEKHAWKTEVFPQEVSGDVICITMNASARRAPVAFSGHLDTVFPVGLFGEPPVKRDEKNIYGPGVTDCKGGIVASLLAMDALDRCGFTDRPIQLLLQSDEEKGSKPSGRATINWICEKAKDAVAFINCEPIVPGKIIIRRKGSMRFRFTVRGKAAATSKCTEGANAITEAAHKIIELEKMKDLDGAICNCGIISGGTAQNVVPEECIFTADIRYLTDEQCEEAKKIVQKVAGNSTVDGCACTVEQINSRPAMVLCDKNINLAARINEILAASGLPALEPGRKDGGADGAYTTQYGIPTVDGMGTFGGRCHSVEEYGEIASLAETAKRLAAIAAFI